MNEGGFTFEESKARILLNLANKSTTSGAVDLVPPMVQSPGGGSAGTPYTPVQTNPGGYNSFLGFGSDIPMPPGASLIAFLTVKCTFNAFPGSFNSARVKARARYPLAPTGSLADGDFSYQGSTTYLMECLIPMTFTAVNGTGALQTITFDVLDVSDTLPPPGGGFPPPPGLIHGSVIGWAGMAQYIVP